MADVEHKDLVAGEVHALPQWVYADATARLAATGFVAGDVTKVAYQQSDSSVWLLTDDSPIAWKEIGGYIPGGTDVAVSDGGTAASTAAGARTNLGLVIGTNVQAWDADLDTWAGKTAPSGTVVGTSDAQTLTNKTLTADKHDSYVQLAEVAAPGTPPSGQVYVYAKADGLLYSKDDAGAETLVSGGTGGGGGSHNHTSAGGDGGVLTDDEHDGFSEYAEIAAPSTPASGKVRLYPKADGLFYSKDDAGVETLVSGGTGGGGGGAPTTAPYVTTAADAGLSGEIVIPGMAGSADVAGAAGAGFAEEFDSGSSGLTWTTAVATEDVNTTFKSHLYVKVTDTQSDRIGYKAWSPAGDFDIRAKLALGEDVAGGTPGFRLLVLDATNANRLMLQYTTGSSGQIQAYTYSGGGYSLIGSGLAWAMHKEAYLRIVRTGGGNTIRWYASHNGLVWTPVVSTTFAITVARRGLGIESSTTSVATHVVADWWRADV